MWAEKPFLDALVLSSMLAIYDPVVGANRGVVRRTERVCSVAARTTQKVTAG